MGGTLVAIVLGPWAAVITVSVALILQALFFGDGGILAIFANCFNMAVVLPFVGYYVYRLIAARAALLSTRRVWAAAIGAYLGLTAAALAVAVELGLQPLLFNDGGRAAVQPVWPRSRDPGDVLAHASARRWSRRSYGSRFRYVQQHHPEYLTSLGRVVSGADVETGEARAASVWQTVALGIVIGVPILLAAGLVMSGGNAGSLFGAGWSQVDWPSVGAMLLVTLVVAAIVVPLVWLLSPRKVRGIGTAYAVAAVLVPLG